MVAVLTLMDFAQIIIALGAVVGSIAVIVKYTVGGLDRRIQHKIEEATKELRSNDGQSVKDQIADIHEVMVPPSKPRRPADEPRYRD